jgi:hypothetical protein
MPYGIKNLRWTLITLVIVLTAAVLVPPERALLTLFDSLARYPEPAATPTDSNPDTPRSGGLGSIGGLSGLGGLTGGDVAQPLSSEIRLDLARFGAWPPQGAADWWAFNWRFLVQLVRTLALMLPVGVLIAAIGYVLAVGLFQLSISGAGAWPEPWTQPSMRYPTCFGSCRC